MLLTFAGGATAIWDANRYNEVEAASPRYTFGSLRIDATGGHLTLATDSTLRVKPLGQPGRDWHYSRADVNFAGDCVYFLQRHFVECMLSGREFESNGPDVKIRGTAAHIAEKYMSLARDALASGDMVMAESYFQHAEHYFRILNAMQQMQAPQQGQPTQPRRGVNGYEGEGDPVEAAVEQAMNGHGEGANGQSLPGEGDQPKPGAGAE